MDEAHAGDIVMVAGLSEIGIGDTIVDPSNPNVSQTAWNSCTTSRDKFARAGRSVVKRPDFGD